MWHQNHGSEGRCRTTLSSMELLGWASSHHCSSAQELCPSCQMFPYAGHTDIKLLKHRALSNLCFSRKLPMIHFSCVWHLRMLWSRDEQCGRERARAVSDTQGVTYDSLQVHKQKLIKKATVSFLYWSEAQKESLQYLHRTLFFSLSLRDWVLVKIRDSWRENKKQTNKKNLTRQTWNCFFRL